MKCEFCQEHYPETIGFFEPGRCDVCGASVEARMNEKIVMYDSEEAATYRRDIEGWVDRHGIFCGKSEDLARWRGCTHRPCSKCGKPAPKSYTVCDDCRRKAEVEKYEARERKDWDEKNMVYSDALDRFYNSWDEINDAADEYEMEVEGLRLLICEPVFAREIEPEDYYHDLLPDEGTLPEEIEEAFKTLNKAIRDCKTPLSWEPSKFAVRLTGEFCPHDCMWLSPTEEEQGTQKIKDNHMCGKFGVRVYHDGNHPSLKKCWQCLEAAKEV